MENTRSDRYLISSKQNTQSIILRSFKFLLTIHSFHLVDLSMRFFTGNIWSDSEKAADSLCQDFVQGGRTAAVRADLLPAWASHEKCISSDKSCDSPILPRHIMWLCAQTNNINPGIFRTFAWLFPNYVLRMTVHFSRKVLWPLKFGHEKSYNCTVDTQMLLSISWSI